MISSMARSKPFLLFLILWYFQCYMPMAMVPDEDNDRGRISLNKQDRMNTIISLFPKSYQDQKVTAEKIALKLWDKGITSPEYLDLLDTIKREDFEKLQVNKPQELLDELKKKVSTTNNAGHNDRGRISLNKQERMDTIISLFPKSYQDEKVKAQKIALKLWDKGITSPAYLDLLNTTKPGDFGMLEVTEAQELLEKLKKKDPRNEPDLKEKFVKIQEEVRLVLNGSSKVKDVALKLWFDGVRNRHDFVLFDNVYTVEDFPMLDQIQAQHLLTKLKERGGATDNKDTSSKNPTPKTTLKPITTTTPVATTRNHSNTNTPVATTRNHSNTNTPVATTRNHSNTNTPVATTRNHSNTNTPLATTRNHSNTNTPLATTRNHSNTNTPLATTRNHSNTNTPVATIRKPSKTITPVASTRKPSDTTTPVATTRKTSNTNTPVATTRKPSDTSTTKQGNNTSTTLPVKGDNHDGAQHVDADSDKGPGSARLIVFILFAILIVVIFYMGYTNRTKEQAKTYPVQQYYARTSGGVACQPGSKPVSSADTVLTHIHEAVSCLSPAGLEDLILNNPDAVHEQGFNGQLPLHKACLRGETEIVMVLLRHHADINATNNFGETPLHFAARRGNPRLLHLLVENDADLGATDQAGRSALHHAAEGGSVYTMHYLVEVCGQDTRERSKQFATPLHLVCEHGYLEATRYLLKKERSDVFARNAAGNTALHIAAEKGNGFTCWKLLQVGGLKLLHVTNDNGQTALQLAQAQQMFRVRDVTRFLSWHSRRSGTMVTGPSLSWYWLLVVPFVMYPVIPLVAWLAGQRRGLVSAVCLLLLIFFLYRHSHRMQHISRWPSPIYLGMFAAGLLHTLTCYFVLIFPSTYEDHVLLTSLSIPVSALLIYIYYTLLTRDPGECRSSKQKEGSDELYGIKDVATGQVDPDLFCQNCEIVIPTRARHCKLCEKCYHRMDHHCLFLFRCVAKHNHRRFVLFIMLCIFSMLMFVYLAFKYMQKLYPDMEYNIWGWLVLDDYPWLWTIMLVNVLSAVWGLCLLRYQLNVISKGQTTAWQPHRDKCTLTPKQRFYNVIHFFAGKKPHASEFSLSV